MLQSCQKIGCLATVDRNRTVTSTTAAGLRHIVVLLQRTTQDDQQYRGTRALSAQCFRMKTPSESDITLKSVTKHN